MADHLKNMKEGKKPFDFYFNASSDYADLYIWSIASFVIFTCITETEKT